MIREITLKSGVKLILDPVESVKSVCVGIWCGSGSQNENKDEAGISHFIEHMLFKGTPTRNAFQIVQTMDSYGAEINAFTSKMRTCFYFRSISEHLYSCCDVLVDMIEHPLFDQSELDREKLVIIEEINMNADDPDDVAMELLDSIILDGSTLASPILGTKESVSAFDHDALNKYYREHYTRDNLVVSISGCFDEDKITEYFDSCFFDLDAKCRQDDFGKPVGRKENRTVTKDIEQAHIIMGLTTVPADDRRRYHMSILSTIMGGGMSSRLFQNIREKKGLAYSIYSGNSFFDSTGEFCIFAGVAKNKVDEFLEGIKEELDRLDREPIDPDEFATAKEQLKSSVVFSMEGVQSRMRLNGRNYFNHGRCMDQDELIDILNSITIEDIEETKKLISNYDNYTIVNVTGKN
ncbi:MAG: insulinase family protein [Clostridiales bacterium]|nr:insulinase family protein [Candidatus Crickella caballi]